MLIDVTHTTQLKLVTQAIQSFVQYNQISYTVVCNYAFSRSRVQLLHKLLNA